MSPTTMNRREALQRMALLMGGTMVGPRLLQAALAADPAKGVAGVRADELALLDEIGDTIIPATDVPGAKAVHIGAFITMMLRDCYDAADVAAVDGGVRELAQNFRLKHGYEFVGAPAAERTDFLNAIDRDQLGSARTRKSDAPAHYFRILKELTVLGYFSSEIGATQALRFIEVPGRFDGSAPYKKGEHAWFS
jgi:hypothetical protein